MNYNKIRFGIVTGLLCVSCGASLYQLNAYDKPEPTDVIELKQSKEDMRKDIKEIQANSPLDTLDFSHYLEDEDEPILLTKEIDIYNKYIDLNNQLQETLTAIERRKIGNQLIEKSKEYTGIPYLWGGTNPSVGLDCSAFVQLVYREFGYELPRVSYHQAKVGKLVSRKELKKGDLLFFDTRNPRNLRDIRTPTEEMAIALETEKGFKPNKVSHVGIYTGDGKMIHASSQGIREEKLGDYYQVRFLHARRIMKGDN